MYTLEPHVRHLKFEREHYSVVGMFALPFVAMLEVTHVPSLLQHMFATLEFTALRGLEVAHLRISHSPSQVDQGSSLNSLDNGWMMN